MSYVLISAEGLVRNNLQQESGRAGYLQNNASTTESQLLMIRGYARAYQATGDVAFLNQAKTLYGAFKSVFCSGVSPAAQLATSSPWWDHWVANAGDSFQVKGPISPYNSAFSGVLAEAHTFVNGVAVLPATLANVYSVFDSPATLLWQNVFAAPTTGSEHTIASFVDANGYLFVYASSTQTWTASAAPVSSPAAGTVTLVDTTINGTKLINYSTYVSTTIPRATLYEAWPMWRPLASGEAAVAGDTVHWAVDTFRLLQQVEPTNPEWPAALGASMIMWGLVTTFPGGNYVFQHDISSNAPYNSTPLTYFYVLLNSGPAVSEPTTYCTYTRDPSNGFAKFILPSDSNRAQFVFENSPLFVTYTPASTMTLNWSLTTPALLQVGFVGSDNIEYRRRVYTSATTFTTAVLPTNTFRNFAGVSAGVWQAGDAQYSYGGASLTLTISTDGQYTPFQTAALPQYAGMGNAGAFTTALAPPILAYTSTGALKLNIRDANGWRWDIPLPMQTTLAEFTPLWSSATLASYQSGGTGGTPTLPVTTAPWTQFEIRNDNAAVTTVSLAYAVATSPAVASSNNVKTARVQLLSQAANTIEIGDAFFSSVTIPSLNYTPGVVAFNLPAPGTKSYAAGTAYPTGAAFRGPVYTGYQNPLPWLYVAASVPQQTNIMQFITDSQAAYAAQSPAGAISGPYAPVYIWSSWDATLYGTAGTWTWNGADPNTSWGGFQYRTFCNVADYWQRATTFGVSNAAVTQAAASTNLFMTWLKNWFVANPYAPAPPGTFAAGVAPSDMAEVQMAANALKGVIFARLAGADKGMTAYLIQRLLTFLASQRVSSGDMMGSLSPNPASHQWYGFWSGEVMDALAVVAVNAKSLSDIGQRLLS